MVTFKSTIQGMVALFIGILVGIISTYLFTGDQSIFSILATAITGYELGAVTTGIIWAGIIIIWIIMVIIRPLNIMFEGKAIELAKEKIMERK